MAKTRTATKIGLLALGMAVASCSSQGTSSTPVLQDVSSIIFLQRAPRNDNGNVFDYASALPGARLVTLTPPAANGKLNNLTSDPMFATADIMSYDLSFDAKSVVFSANLTGGDGDHFQIFSMNMDGTNLQQLTEGENDYVYPVYLPGQRIMFMTNKNVEADVRQFRDEYERAVTAQVGTMAIDGSDQVLGARNVSHRVAPALMPDGRVVYTEWRHMGTVNDGHLRLMDSDMTSMREAFGGEQGGNGGPNSYLKARPVQTITHADGTVDQQLVAIGTSRDRTLQAGKLLLIDLNGSEALSKFTDLTPLVPGTNSPSALGVGRYYDAESIGDPNDQKFLTSWADGPVESEFLAMANSTANFGLYVYDGKSGTRSPIFDDLNMWDVLARPVKARQEPVAAVSPVDATVTSSTFGCLNVYDSSVATIPAGSVVKVRLIEGFSGEEGIRSFGTTEFDGQSLYAELPIAADNSFAAKVPGNVPFHMQVIDKYSMSIVNESVWISGRAGEQRFCGGCHENRTESSLITPGVNDAILSGAVDLNVPRPQRVYAAPNDDYADNYGSIRGVPWDHAIQPILTAKCVSCHDGDASKPGNPTYMVTDMTSGTSQTFTFNLSGDKLNVTVGEKMTGDFTQSYISLMGLGEIIGEDVVQITGDYHQDGYAVGGSAATSSLIQMLNPPQQFPTVDETVRRFSSSDTPFTDPDLPPIGSIHPTELGGMGLTPEEFRLLILSIDMGGQFFSRENKDETMDPYAGGT